VHESVLLLNFMSKTGRSHAWFLGENPAGKFAKGFSTGSLCFLPNRGARLEMSEFVEYLKEVFLEFGAVTARKMFGGHGIIFDGVMIGLVADDTLYLKVDAESVPKFREHGLSQFMYPKGKKMVGMSYYLAPEEALEDPSEMRQWAQLAYEAALRTRK